MIKKNLNENADKKCGHEISRKKSEYSIYPRF